ASPTRTSRCAQASIAYGVRGRLGHQNPTARSARDRNLDSSMPGRRYLSQWVNVAGAAGMREFALGTQVVLGLMPEAGIRSLLGPSLPDPAAAHGIPRAEIYLVADDAAACHARALAAGGPNCPHWPGGPGETT